MKIDPKKDYKKPLYAAGIATLIGATALFGTACGPQIAGGISIGETTTEVQLGGDAQTVETEEVELMGEFDIDDVQNNDETVCSVETEPDESEETEAEEEAEEEETEAEE